MRAAKVLISEDYKLNVLKIHFGFLLLCRFPVLYRKAMLSAEGGGEVEYGK